jgi:hypothetical protein
MEGEGAAPSFGWRVVIMSGRVGASMHEQVRAARLKPLKPVSSSGLTLLFKEGEEDKARSSWRGKEGGLMLDFRLAASYPCPLLFRG